MKIEKPIEIIGEENIKREVYTVAHVFDMKLVDILKSMQYLPKIIKINEQLMEVLDKLKWFALRETY
ncbi:MAG: hypothetical protein EAX96_20860 [Candidatus Lokiarchaeota archaeon]|nr:hypothetical protein [Candidatus Lokiarchaeota archaeon]